MIVFENVQKKKCKSHLNEITASYWILHIPCYKSWELHVEKKHLRQEIQNCKDSDDLSIARHEQTCDGRIINIRKLFQ